MKTRSPSKFSSGWLVPRCTDIIGDRARSSWGRWLRSSLIFLTGSMRGLGTTLFNGMAMMLCWLLTMSRLVCGRFSNTLSSPFVRPGVGRLRSRGRRGDTRGTSSTRWEGNLCTSSDQGEWVFDSDVESSLPGGLLLLLPQLRVLIILLQQISNRTKGFSFCPSNNRNL
jgi:hypothetical protein